MAVNKQKMLSNYEAYEEVFAGAGVVEQLIPRGDGDEAVSTIESIEFSVKEFIGTRDAVWMFPRVVQKTLIEAAEPVYTVTPLLNVVRINTGVRTVDYMAVGAMQAFEVPEGMEYPTEDLAWSTGSKTAKVTKKGLRIPITDEMLEDSQFDLISMYLRAGGRAMARFKEQLAVVRFVAAAQTVKENLNTFGGWSAAMATKGIGSDGNPNGTLDSEDLIEVIGTMAANGVNATDVIMHPLAFAVWANDPLIKNLSWYQSGLGLGKAQLKLSDNKVSTASGFASFLQRTAPMGLNVITSPYIPYDAVNNRCDIMVIDRTDVGALTVREDMSTEQFDDPTRDIISLKVKERYDVTIFPSTGYNICRLGNIAVARNYGRDVSFANDLAGGGFDAFAGFGS
jgi:hypothetical protein